jgi:hypothetical protein
MTPLRQFLVVQSLLLWQGGFLFYAAFVVPAGTEVLGSAAAQGAITVRATAALNVCGVAALALSCWDLSRTAAPSARLTAARWWCWTVAAVCQWFILFFHALLTSFMSPDRVHVVVGPPFRPVHRAYLWLSTVQWVACLVLAWATLRAWAAEDRQPKGA